ncbi:MAG TPA: IS110 family transposase [Streptosporangiaceae bacterium]|nr:IS110 family transposase [Streptosporangiaceae bacterium]
MSTVVIGMDPHKRSATIEVMAADERVVGGGRYGTDVGGYAAMLAGVRRWRERIWAIEGSRGVGRQLASRLVAAGEQVVDVPPKLSARTRVFTAGQGRKTDVTDAHAVALAATRMKGLQAVSDDDRLAVLRVLADRRRALGEDHARMICQLHQLLADLIPGGAKKALSAAQARALLARVRPRDPAGQARRRVAAELIADLERIYQREKAAGKELTAALKATGTTLTTLEGIGPSGAARLLVEVADITRFPDRGHFASWNGTAPIDASSGDHVRHRLSRAGNRQINRVLHIMAVVQLRHPVTRGRAYYDRKVAAGKTPREAMRALKRRLSDVVFRQMKADARAARTGPGGHSGAAAGSSAAGSDPDAGSSDKSLPGPATSDPTPILPAIPAAIAARRTAAAVKRTVLDGGRTGAHSQGGNNHPLTQWGARCGYSP